MVFQIAFFLFNAAVQPLDVSVLPMEIRTHIKDPRDGRYILWERNLMRMESEDWVSGTRLHLNFATDRWDTTVTYLRLDSARRVIRSDIRMGPDPVVDGGILQYEQGRVVSRTTYRNGVKAHRTTYRYADGRLVQALGEDSAGTVLDTVNYIYRDGLLAEREELPARDPRDFNRKIITYLGPDSILFQDANPIGDTSDISHVKVVREGRVVKQYDYDETGQFGYSDFVYTGGTSVRRAPAYQGARTGARRRRDLLGRLQPLQTRTKASVSSAQRP